MVKIKVDAVSQFGVKVDGKWVNFSKGFKPDVLRDNSYDVTLDSKGKIKDIVAVGGSSLSTDKPVSNGDSVRQREILKGQCLNLTFENLSNNPRSPEFDLRDASDRKELLEQTAILFAEIQNAGFLRW